MKLWGGRFTKETDQLVHNFNESLSFDQKFYHQDIEGSIAHVKMLEKQGILTVQDRDDIIRGLERDVYKRQAVWSCALIMRSFSAKPWKAVRFTG